MSNPNSKKKIALIRKKFEMKRPTQQIPFNINKRHRSMIDGSRPRESPVKAQKTALPIFRVKKRWDIFLYYVNYLTNAFFLLIWGWCYRLLAELEKSDTVVLLGETGCGKTTQLPQYLFEAKLNNNGVIGITQVVLFIYTYWMFLPNIV